ncbi:MAG: hypothetical protein H0X51_00695 [Parachlamydiaceae bacterium]|nr:hypothetical protein [Parachlamydiaceae bacterium]
MTSPASEKPVMPYIELMSIIKKAREPTEQMKTARKILGPREGDSDWMGFSQEQVEAIQAILKKVRSDSTMPSQVKAQDIPKGFLSNHGYTFAKNFFSWYCGPGLVEQWVKQLKADHSDCFLDHGELWGASFRISKPSSRQIMECGVC